MKEYDQLLKHWNDYNPNDGIHKNDKINTNSKICRYNNLNEYIGSSHYYNDSFVIHSGLMPEPYCGDILNSKVYFLLLNPGFSPQDYFDESIPSFKQTIRNTQLQNEKDFPFFPLNPYYCWTSSAQYWHRKMKPVISLIKEKMNANYFEACIYLRDKLCIVELFPYHSKIFNISSREIMEIESVKLIKNYVKSISINKSKLFIVMRQIKNWDLSENENILTFSNGEARGANLTDKHILKISTYL